MSTFASVAVGMLDSDVETFGGREKASALLGRLDASWDGLSRTTLGVMLAVVACATDKAAAIKCLSGMLGMLGKMSGVYCALLGWQGEPADQAELMGMSKAVDAAGQELGGKVDGLGAAVMVGLLQAVPPMWTAHFRQLLEARAGLSRLAAARSLPHLSNAVAGVQAERTAWLVGMAGRSVFALNSVPNKRAADWAKAAGGVFSAVLAGGYRPSAALAEAVRKVGFPDAMRK